MAHHLARSVATVCKAEAINDVVEAALKELEQDFAGDATRVAGDLEGEAELALQQVALVAELLLLGEGERVFAGLAAAAFGPCMPGG